MEIIIEKGKGNDLWGLLSTKGYTTAVVGHTIEEVTEGIREQIKDHMEHEGKESKFWNRIDLDTIQFKMSWNVHGFFIEHPYIDIPAISRLAGLKSSLVKQLPFGEKYATQEQAKRQEEVIHRIGSSLVGVSLASTGRVAHKKRNRTIC